MPSNIHQTLPVVVDEVRHIGSRCYGSFAMNAGLELAKVNLIIAHAKVHPTSCSANTDAVVIDRPIAMVTLLVTSLGPRDNCQVLQAPVLVKHQSKTSEVGVHGLVNLGSISTAPHAADDAAYIKAKTYFI